MASALRVPDQPRVGEMSPLPVAAQPVWKVRAPSVAAARKCAQQRSIDRAGSAPRRPHGCAAATEGARTFQTGCAATGSGDISPARG
ncbi:MAG: hypothetical protein AAF568_03080 [Pseudomonadota bacterium]